MTVHETPGLFDDIAPIYRRWSAILSADGIHFWHQFAIEQMRLEPGMTVLDVGCGIGNVTKQMARLVGPRGRVTGLDPSFNMLLEARREPKPGGAEAPIQWVLGSGEQMPFFEESFQRVTAQFSVRNMQDWRQALTEMVRVLAVGGRLVILDLVQPVTVMGALAMRGLEILTRELPEHSPLESFQWLGRSIHHAPTAKEMENYLQALGMQVQTSHYWLGDLVWVGVVEKAAHATAASPSPAAPVVVWATDGSLTALEGGLWIQRAIKSSAEVHVLTVLPPHLAANEVGEAEREAWFRYRERSRALLDRSGLQVVSVLRQGVPGEEIIRYASEVHADLVVLGFKGRSRRAEQLFGGVTRYVWSHAHCAVVSIPSDAPVPPFTIG